MDNLKGRGKMSALRRAAIILTIILFSNVYGSAAEVLTNQSVVDMVASGFGDALIISKIKASERRFDVSVEALKDLKEKGISDEIIKAMIGTPEEGASGGTADQGINVDNGLQEASRLMEYDKFDEAIQLLNNLAKKSSDVRCQFALIDALTEKGWKMKEANNPDWRSVAEEAQVKIKGLYRANYTNPAYWLPYVNLSSLIDNQRHLNGGLNKAMYYKADYVKVLILKGDAYFRLAKFTNEVPAFDNKNRGADDRAYRARVARSSYEDALKNSSIDEYQKAYVYYRLGELETQLFNNRKRASEYWELAVASAPDKRWGELSRERLNAYK